MTRGSHHGYATKRRLSLRCRQHWTAERRAQQAVKTRERIAKARLRQAAEVARNGP